MAPSIWQLSLGSLEGAPAVRPSTSARRTAVAWLASLALATGCEAAPAPPGTATADASTSVSASVAPSPTSAASAASASAVDGGAAPAVALTNFDGAPPGSLPWAHKKLRWAKAKLELRAIEGWQSELVKGYPVLRTADRHAFVALFGDVGALPPRTHLDMRLGWFEAGRVDWAISQAGKLGEKHLVTEQSEGSGKIGVTKDGVTKVHAARFWALYVELPGRSDGLLVLAAATDEAKDRHPEIVGMVQSLGVPAAE
jgi:hypothetical protein